MTQILEIEEVENGFILKEKMCGGKTYIFKTFDELVKWIKEVYPWR